MAGRHRCLRRRAAHIYRMLVEDGSARGGPVCSSVAALVGVVLLNKSLVSRFSPDFPGEKSRTDGRCGGRKSSGSVDGPA